MVALILLTLPIVVLRHLTEQYRLTFSSVLILPGYQKSLAPSVEPQELLAVRPFTIGL